MLVPNAKASQWGPVFPSHHYPTDKSFLLNTSFNYGAESTYYDQNSSRQDLGATLTRLRFLINPEYQPTRQLALGAYLNFDSLKLSGNGEQLTKSGFSDQFLFGEYRVVDERGYSMGFGTVFKIPLYSTPNSVDPADGNFLLLGDGQIDATLLYCGEYWPWKQFKLLGDAGFTYRTDEHATELPFQLGGEYVTPRYNIGLSILGNLSFNNDKATQTTTSQDIQTLTGNTRYVYATNPATINVLIKTEYAFSPSWAVFGKFENSLWAKNAPYFLNFAIGLSYRIFEPEQKVRRAREVGIETDDSSQDFDGELQEDLQDELLTNDPSFDE